MCGLAGFWKRSGGGEEELRALAERMTTPICHRGPDDSGIWVEPSVGLALGFRRLAILDLSEAGHQPMRSASGRFTMTYNGEVYNFQALRKELEAAGARFRGTSDTEVMLAAFERWGIRASVQRFVGMFAIAVWDAQERTLSLVRDRLGIKPMFIATSGQSISWGSELKALLGGPSFDRTLDREAVTAFLRYLYVPAPRTIFRGVRKLMPGHILTIRDPGSALPASEPYWSAVDAAEQGRANVFQGSDAEAVDELERLLTEAVELRMIADVPLGSLLSGGIDSSTVTALMQARSSAPVRTYSIAFDDPAYDEASHAALVAKHLGTQHTAVMLTGEDALAVVPRLADMFDEPLADPSQIPTYLVSQLARRDVTVALSGDGGDELFAGYNRYSHGERMVGRLSRMPRPVRRLLAAGIGAVAQPSWDRLHQSVAPALPSGLQQRLPGEKLYKIGRLLESDGEAGMYRSLVSAWQRPEALVLGGHDEADALTRIVGGNGALDLLDRMMLADQVGYLADDLLAKLDRASMVVSLEARVPILDHRVVEFSWRLPRRFKIRDGQGKWILRQVLHKYVPPAMVERPKMGFSVPIDAWLRGPLRSWADDLLSQDRIARDGVLDPLAVRSAWQSFQDGHASGLMLWTVLMFQAWHERWARS